MQTEMETKLAKNKPIVTTAIYYSTENEGYRFVGAAKNDNGRIKTMLNGLFNYNDQLYYDYVTGALINTDVLINSIVLYNETTYKETIMYVSVYSDIGTNRNHITICLSDVNSRDDRNQIIFNYSESLSEYLIKLNPGNLWEEVNIRGNDKVLDSDGNVILESDEFIPLNYNESQVLFRRSDLTVLHCTSDTDWSLVYAEDKLGKSYEDEELITLFNSNKEDLIVLATHDFIMKCYHAEELPEDDKVSLPTLPDHDGDSIGFDNMSNDVIDAAVTAANLELANDISNNPDKYLSSTPVDVDSVQVETDDVGKVGNGQINNIQS